LSNDWWQLPDDSMHALQSGINEPPTAPDLLLRNLIGFTRLMHANGYKVGVREQLDALSIANEAGILDPQRLRWGLRSLLCSSDREWHQFDTLFREYWFPANRAAGAATGKTGAIETRTAADGQLPAAPAAETDHAGSGPAGDLNGGAALGGASPQEAIGQTDFRLLADPRQMQQMERLVERLARRMRRRLTRRQRIARAGRRIHMRRTIRNNLRYGGTPLELAFRLRRRELPRLILLLDVSRSMSLYSYLLLRFARGIVESFQEAEAFVFHTRLVAVTAALRERDIHKVKEKLVVLSAGWSGGTRIGECLQAFNQGPGARMLNSRSKVIIVSDGFDTGPPDFLAGELAYIKRRASKIVWLNPLLGREGYQPLAAGMQAALPWIDLFAPAHNLDSLLELEPRLVKL
jgi:uncharacterized protein with von Willebrand factor type A (vWA) domain